MKPRKTTVTNAVLHDPDGNEDDFLDVLDTERNGKRVVASFWELTAAERTALAVGGRVLIILETDLEHHPPLGVTVSRLIHMRPVDDDPRHEALGHFTCYTCGGVPVDRDEHLAWHLEEGDFEA